MPIDTLEAAADTLASRACPLCRWGGMPAGPRIFAEANVDFSRLDRFAFASRKRPEYMHHRLLECPGCDLVYASPAPAAEALERAYLEADFDSGEEAGYAASTYARALGRIIRRLPDQVGALDIGTGDGAFLEHLLGAGFTGVEGVEPSSAPIASARPEIRPLIRHTAFRPGDFARGAYSLVTCFQTLEHVDDPLALCGAAFAMLKEGGAAYVVVHDRRALSARVLGRRSPIFDVEHLQLFSPRSLRALLERSGFVDVTVRPIVNRYPLGYWVRLLPLPPRFKRRSLAALKASGLGRLMVSLPAGNLAAIGFRPAGAGASGVRSCSLEGFRNDRPGATSTAHAPGGHRSGGPRR